MSITVEVKYQISSEFGINKDIDSKIEVLAVAVGGKFTGSGSGHYERDLEYEFPNKQDCEVFKAGVYDIDDSISHILTWGEVDGFFSRNTH